MSGIRQLVNITFTAKTGLSHTEYTSGTTAQILYYCENINQSFASTSEYEVIGTDHEDYNKITQAEVCILDSEPPKHDIPDEQSRVQLTHLSGRTSSIVIPNLERSKYLTVSGSMPHHSQFLPKSNKDCQTLIDFLEHVKNTLPVGV